MKVGILLLAFLSSGQCIGIDPKPECKSVSAAVICCAYSVGPAMTNRNERYCWTTAQRCRKNPSGTERQIQFCCDMTGTPSYDCSGIPP